MPGAAAQERTSDDFALMDGVCAGDHACLKSLYDRHSGLVFTLAFRIVRDRMTAEDVMIDVFWELWSRCGQYNSSRGSPLTYLLTMTRSRAIDRRRSGLRRSAVLAGDPESHQPAQSARSADTPLNDAMTGELAQRVRAAMERLDPVQRQAVELSFFDDLSHSEIAAQLGKPLGTVKTNIRQGLIRLRDCMRMD